LNRSRHSLIRGSHCLNRKCDIYDSNCRSLDSRSGPPGSK